ncbi:hypothetical protein EON63_22790 [archaeon]|nr:MAG: hypothetical protein EON63_22790 [archaeon]
MSIHLTYTHPHVPQRFTMQEDGSVKVLAAARKEHIVVLVNVPEGRHTHARTYMHILVYIHIIH